MRRTLDYIPQEMVAIGDYGFGWLLIGWVVFSVLLLVYLTWRQGWNRDTASYLPILLLFGCAIWWLLPQLVVTTRSGQPVGLPIRGYGVMVMIGVISAVALAAYRAGRMGLSSEIMLSLAMWVFVPGIIGARLVFILQYWSLVAVEGPNQQIDWPKTLATIVSFQEGGLVVYGAFAGGAFGCILFVCSKRLPPLAILDLIAPSVMVGLAIGRVGCLMNGCCFGGLCEATSPFYPLAITFPRAASPELEEDRPVESHENSPPYAAQRERGLFHGLLVSKDDQHRPVIARIDTEVVTPSAADGDEPLQVNDRIKSINGTRVTELSLQGVPISQADHAYRLLGQTGLEVTVETDRGSVVSWSIPKFPERSLPVHPSQLYSAIGAGLLALFLWFFYPFGRRDGEVFALLLTIYPIARLILEVIRDDEGGQLGTQLTLSQWISVFTLVTAAGFWLYVIRQPVGRALPAEAGGTL